MIVSLAKTNIMGFGQNITTQKLYFGESEISPTYEYRYLGTVVNVKGQLFKQNLKKLVEKAQRAVYALKSNIKITGGHLQPSLAMKMFDAQISPILEYCSEIWYTNKFCEELEKIHLVYMKDILKVKQSSSTLHFMLN